MCIFLLLIAFHVCIVRKQLTVLFHRLLVVMVFVLYSHYKREFVDNHFLFLIFKLVHVIVTCHYYIYCLQLGHDLRKTICSSQFYFELITKKPDIKFRGCTFPTNPPMMAMISLMLNKGNSSNAYYAAMTHSSC